MEADNDCQLESAMIPTDLVVITLPPEIGAPFNVEFIARYLPEEGR